MSLSKHCYLFTSWISRLIALHIVGNKAKGRNSKWVLEENKARQIIQKTTTSYPPDTHTHMRYQEVRNVRFSENLVCFVFL